MKYKSEIYEAVYEDAVEMFKIGAISESRMREYEKMCLVDESKFTHNSKQLIIKESPIVAYN
jgi:DNA-binding transcriptional regulator YiaG